jgi:hypothetical protein
MPDGFRLVPVKPEVTAGDGQIRGHGQFLAAAQGQERAVVANSQTQAAIPATAGCAECPSANFAEQGEFAWFASGSKMGQFYRHLTRIGQVGKILTAYPQVLAVLRRSRWRKANVLRIKFVDLAKGGLLALKGNPANTSDRVCLFYGLIRPYALRFY